MMSRLLLNIHESSNANKTLPSINAFDEVLVDGGEAMVEAKDLATQV